MSNIAYYALWLAVALVLIAVVSAVIAKRLRLREVRRVKAVQMLDALDRYLEWVAAQRRSTFFQGEVHASESPLEEAKSIKAGWFPELSADMDELLMVHGRFVDHLWNQQLQRLKDPEAWLESDHDARFLELWRHHRYAVAAIADKLRAAAGELARDIDPETIFPA